MPIYCQLLELHSETARLTFQTYTAYWLCTVLTLTIIFNVRPAYFIGRSFRCKNQSIPRPHHGHNSIKMAENIFEEYSIPNQNRYSVDYTKHRVFLGLSAAKWHKGDGPQYVAVQGAIHKSWRRSEKHRHRFSSTNFSTIFPASDLSSSSSANAIPLQQVR